MSLDGLYNIKLNGGSPNANSCAVGSATSPGVKLIQFNGSDPTQKWTICPIGGLGPNFYTIQSRTAGLYVIPQGDNLALSINPFLWIINNGLISTPKAPTLNWIPGDNGQVVIITPNSSWTWTLSPAS